MMHGRDWRGRALVLLAWLPLPGGCMAVLSDEPLVMEGSERGSGGLARAEALVREAQISLRGERSQPGCQPDPPGAVPPPSTSQYFLELDPAAIEEYGFFEEGTFAQISMKPGAHGHLFDLLVVVADGRCVSFELGLVVE